MGPDAPPNTLQPGQCSLVTRKRRYLLYKQVSLKLVPLLDRTTYSCRVVSTFFSLGQTLPTYRHGVGIFQPALDDAITLLSQGNAWLHVFPEGRIRQDKQLSSKPFLFECAKVMLTGSNSEVLQMGHLKDNPGDLHDYW